MDKSKRYFAIFAAAIILISLLAMAFGNNIPPIMDSTPTEAPTSSPTVPDHTEVPTTSATEPSAPTTPAGTEPDNLNTAPSDDNTTPTDGFASNQPETQFDFTETIQVSDTVTIRKVATDPNEVIDRDSRVDETHPEYIAYGDVKSIFSVEGKVFRNDRVISIEVQDRYVDTTYTISFGYPTGECNRFLYLNPTCELNPVVDGFYEADIHFNFLTSGDGEVANLGAEALAYQHAENLTYKMTRHLDEGGISANYLNAQYPGSVWYTYFPLEEEHGEIHCRVFSSNGYHIATLALIVEKDEQGCYMLTDIRNLDLWVDNSEYPMFTHKELEAVCDLLEQNFAEKNISHLQFRYGDIEITPDNCTFVLRTSETSYYYSNFVNINPNGSDNCREVARGMPYTLAVTMNAHTYTCCGTVYLYITSMPSEDGSEGWYQIVGCDYKDFENADDVKNPRPDF